MPARTTITIFSDFTCPFCYATEAALEQRAASEELEIRYRALELFPAPVPLRAPSEEPEWEERVRPLADELGLPLRVPGFRPRTRKAHEAARYAAEHGAEAVMRRALFGAYWGEERDIGRIDVLMELGEACDLDPVALKIALDVDLHREAVLRDEDLALRLRVNRAPTTFLGTGPEARIVVGVLGPADLDAAMRDVV